MISGGGDNETDNFWVLRANVMDCLGLVQAHNFPRQRSSLGSDPKYLPEEHPQEHTCKKMHTWRILACAEMFSVFCKLNCNLHYILERLNTLS